MAVINRTLTAPSYDEVPIYTFIEKGISGTDELRVFAGQELRVNNIWKLLDCRIGLTTDANVDNRRPAMSILSGIGGANTIEYMQTANVPASTTTNTLITPNTYYSNVTSNDHLLGFSEPGWMIANHLDCFRFVIGGTPHAGDAWFVIMRVIWMNKIWGMPNPYASKKVVNVTEI